jgi:Carboxypeptidase regulatory-like domain/Kelch motif
VQKSVTTNAMPAFAENLEGIGNVNGVMPPDTQADVGPNNYVQMVNESLAVWDKHGNLLYGPVPNNTLWQGFGGACQLFNQGDPVTLYDEGADRWFMSQLAVPGGAQGYHECIAVSATPDPTGAWYRYDFAFSQTTLGDYPKFGVWPDAYYMSVNEFLGGDRFTGVSVVSFDRAAMLAGQDARSITFHIGDVTGVYSSLLPIDWEGGALGFNPPVGAPEEFVMVDDDAFGFSPTDRILMWDFHTDWANPQNSTFGDNGAPSRFLETSPFDSDLCNYARSCIPQPGTTAGLDAESDRLLYRAAYRNFGDHQAIVLNHTVDVDGTDHAGIRWYELDNRGSGWSIGQQGTYAPDQNNRWMGSAALDAAGDMAIGYSVSSASTYPSIRVAGRLAGDPAGQLAQGETTLMAASGSQDNTNSRWGDYSAMQVDPTDGCTFWYTNEYYTTTNNGDWHTRIGSFRFPSCTAGAHGDVGGTVTDASTGKPITGATIATSLATTTTDAQGHYRLTLPAGDYQLSVTAFGYVTRAVPLTVADGGTAAVDVALTPEPFVHVTGTVSDGSGQGWPLYARIEITGRPGAPVFTDPATGRYSVDLPQDHTYSLTVTATLPGYQALTDTLAVGTGDVVHDMKLTVPSACTAPSYHVDYGTPALSEGFDGTSTPAGWTVTDNIGQGQVWRFDDPGKRGNLTGGQGNFAIADAWFTFSRLDTSLTSPLVDLSDVPNPVIRFHNDYNAFAGDTADIDVSTDGGATWATVWQHTSDSVRGPDLEEVPIPQAGAQSAVQIRFHYIGSLLFFWQVDDVVVQNRACDPTTGGLMVGTVGDANTDAGIDGATVTSADQPSDTATTAATPDDPGLGDGYYSMFSSLTGSHPFTASARRYQSTSGTAIVAAHDSVRADFTLQAGHVTVAPEAVTGSVTLGGTTTSAIKISNDGGAPATVRLAERGGAFQVLADKGSPLRLVTNDDGDLYSPAWAGAIEDDGGDGKRGDPSAGTPTDPAWTTIAPYRLHIVDNSADIIDGVEYSVGGFDGGTITPNGYAYDPASDAWTAIATMPTPREKPQVAAINGKLYVTGGWDAQGNPIARTDVYSPASDTWTTVAPDPEPRTAAGVAVLDGKMYVIGGCADGTCTPSTDVQRYDPATDTWATVAAYPHAISWQGCGAIDERIYCAGGMSSTIATISTYKDGFSYDPVADTWAPIRDMPIDLWGSAAGAANGLLMLSSGVTNSSTTVTNQGVAYDPSTQEWAALPNAHFPRYRGSGSCGFYKVGGASDARLTPTPDSEQLTGLGQCGTTDVPWLSESATTANLRPGQSVTVTATFAATTVANVVQPGTYTAQLGVTTDTPYDANPVNVTMTVTPPKGWGRVAGTVTGTSCTGVTAPLRAVQIQASGKTFSYALKTAADGTYAFWAADKANTITLIASKDG